MSCFNEGMHTSVREHGATLPIVVGLMVLTSLLTASILISTRAEPLISAGPTIEVTDQGGTRTVLEPGPQPALANAAFFDEVKQEFVTEGLTFVEVNLSAMEIRLWDKGSVALEFPVKTKGRPGTWWETPPGLYQVDTKIRDHVSSFASVRMPYNMPFNGNFFIHGWPTYLDGTPVAGDFSGGCIRLDTEHARALFARVSVGTPILVFEDKFTTPDTEFTYRAPAPSAQSVLIADLSNNHVFVAEDATSQAPLGTLIYPLVAVVASEHLSMERVLTAPEDPAGVLTAGGRYELYELLFPLLMTGNDAALGAIANALGPARLRMLVERKAHALGMVDTSVTSLEAADERNVTTAEDVFQLAKYLTSYRHFVLSIAKGELDSSVYGGRPFPNLMPRLTGGTLAPSVREQLVVSEVPFDGGEREVAVIALGMAPGTALSPSPEEYGRYLTTFYRLVKRDAAEVDATVASPFVETQLPAHALGAYRAWIDSYQAARRESR